MEPPLRRQWWLAWVAAVLAVLTLYYYVQSWIIVASVAAVMAFFIVRQARGSTRSASRSAVYCLDCGEALNPNARQCDSCGSTRWSRPS